MLASAIVIAALVIAWNLLPHALLWALPVPVWAKRRASACFLVASRRGLAVLLPDLLAPIVVPVALLCTPRDATRLPRLFRWWDNDVSINGDQADGEPTYYAPGYDRRSFYARWVWLGLRNRASWLSVRLGHAWKTGEWEEAEHWGDPRTGRDHEGWTLNRRSDVWQLYMVSRIGAGLCLRVNYGFKVWSGDGGRRPVSNLVNISFSVLRWRGTE